MNWIGTGLSVAGILAMIGAIGLGKTTSDVIQVGTYGIARSVADGIQAAIPSFLVPKTGLDTLIPLLTNGAVANAIVAETLKLHQMEEEAKPLKSIIDPLEANLKILTAEQTQLESAASLTWVTLQESQWVKNYKAFIQDRILNARMKSEEGFYRKGFFRTGPSKEDIQMWIATNASAVHILETNMTNIEIGLVPDAIWAYSVGHEAEKDKVYSLRHQIFEIEKELRLKRERGEMGLNISLDSGRISVRMRPEEFQGEFKKIDGALAVVGGFLPAEFLKYIATQIKLYSSINPRVNAITTGLAIEKGRAAFDVLMKHLKGQDAKHQKVLESVKSFVKECSAAPARQCINAGTIDAGIDRLLGELRGRGFDFPENILELIYTAELQESKQLLSARALQRLLDTEEFRKNPNVYTTLLVISLFLGATCFLMAVAYGVSSIITMGILGTINNLLGTLYVKTEAILEASKDNREHVKRMLTIQNARAELLALQDLQEIAVAAQMKGVPRSIIQGLLKDESSTTPRLLDCTQ